MRIKIHKKSEEFQNINLPEINEQQENLEQLNNFLGAGSNGLFLKDGELKNPNFVKKKSGWMLESKGKAWLQELFCGTVNSYLSFNKVDGMELKGKITITNPGDINGSEINNDGGWTNDSNFVDVTYPADQSGLQTQIDGKIISWFQSGDPQPTWDGTNASHAGDMWWNTTSKKLKRWTGTAWSADIEDQKAIDAYTNAADAQDTADGKRRVFTAEPTTPYDVGDLWSAGPTGDLKKCKIARATGAYVAGDWELASNADNTANNVQPYSWISGSKPPIDADHTADIVSAMAYESLVEKAKLGTTVISGGYIKSDLLTANNILTGTLTAVTMQTHSDATIGSKLIAGVGLKIYGDYATWYSGATMVGHIHADNTSNLQIAAYNGKTLELLGAAGVYMNAGGNNCEMRQGNTAYIRITAANYAGFVGTGSKYFAGLYTSSVYFATSSLSQKYITRTASGLDINTGLYVGGALSKASGSFKIDHPLKAKTHWLEHSFVESPDMLNLYTGNAQIKNGVCKIKMPKWFIPLNGKNQDEFTYQMTNIGQPNSLWVKQEMNKKGEVIFAGEKDGKFSYMITAIRHDKWAEKHRVKVESKKII